VRGPPSCRVTLFSGNQFSEPQGTFGPGEYGCSAGGIEPHDITSSVIVEERTPTRNPTPRPTPAPTPANMSNTMIVDHSDCYPSGGWLGTTPSADACAAKCRLTMPNAQRFVWVKNGDGNCKCASEFCSVKSDNYWHKLCATYKYTYGFTMVGEYRDCGHSSWLGATPSAVACAEKCKLSEPNAQRFVWVPRGDKNCKCASATCSVKSDNYWHKMCDTYEYK